MFASGTPKYVALCRSIRRIEDEKPADGYDNQLGRQRGALHVTSTASSKAGPLRLDEP